MEKKIRIIVDGYGGDNAPLAVLEGCRQAAESLNAEIIITGRETALRKTAEENGISLAGIAVADAPDIISMEDKPTEITKSKSRSSMAVGLEMLKRGEGDAFVSAGSTGALLAGGTFIVRRIKGLKRPALATAIPTRKGFYILLDSGANAECRPEMLAQFGIMGSAYARGLIKVENPTVGLINVGAEEGKGTPLQQEAYQLLKKAPVNFIGNVEARDLNDGACHVAVCDGFTGNVVLKLTEGSAAAVMNLVKDALMSSFAAKIGGALIRPALKGLKAKFDYSQYGGVPLLGLAKPVFKAHGSSGALAFKNAIRAALDFCNNKTTERIEKGIGELLALQSTDI
ncbi:MAG: phosphate acyltransferase PlsX [Oscillospiraceae bacterium]|jgi:glycerol-3-phosphate acyltransferase PlsX|nr:phosphate acyltransferase PlsX [Oscillospiraceae bacterium]